MKAVIVSLLLLAASMVTYARGTDEAFVDKTHPGHITGEQIFTHICQGCHMADAKGATGAGRYPSLAGNPKLASAAYPVVMVVNGRGGMPGFAALLTDEQVAGVVNYVRTHFGNHYTDTLKPDDVKPFRPAVAPLEDN